jgi:hypothetical protein
MKYPIECVNGDTDLIRLSTGREVYANNGIFGLGPDLVVTSGYDDERVVDDHDGPWSADEKLELADMMIKRWERFKQEVGK